jgi:hypothetical protein
VGPAGQVHRATAVPAAVATGVPTVIKARKVQLAVGGLLGGSRGHPLCAVANTAASGHHGRIWVVGQDFLVYRLQLGCLGKSVVHKQQQEAPPGLCFAVPLDRAMPEHTQLQHRKKVWPGDDCGLD